MDELYEQFGQYIVTCVENKDTIELLVKELSPLMNQINYAALTADKLQESTDRLGFGDQAQVILSNVVTIYRVNGGNVQQLLNNVGIDNVTVETIMSDLNFTWVTAGILLMGSGVLSQLREVLTHDPKRSNTDRT